ncbi:chloramphenicol resistance protein [Thalassotalea marina]|uniref:Chloramphenicol resistance protein n=2 Tax=Thalassotalea marina TaxID=1673741 RepID=A0A919ELP6_9GAMM|nr:chloramphenicol resistance protein [Thalassotalea marina]
MFISVAHFTLASDDMSQLKARVLTDFLPKVSEQNIDHHIVKQAKSWQAKQDNNGSWQDIDYGDTRRAGWPPIKHLNRLTLLVKAYAMTNNEQYLDASKKALNYWFESKPSSTNWWWASIGIPLQLGPVGLLLGDDISQDLKDRILASLPPRSILEVPANTPKHAGANRTDIAKAILHAGLIKNQESDIKLALGAIEETIAITEGEGIQQDFSFHQHGPLLHNGSYGKVFMHTALYWGYLVRDLKWAFKKDKVDILSAYILDGDRWMTRGNTIDYSTMGRAISRPNASFGAISQAARYLAELDSQRREEALAFAHYLEGGDVGLNGVKHYWRSDYSVVQRPEYQFTVHMHSTRVRPTETGNGENLKGKWLGFGNTFLRLTGDEYHGIFPVWDWARLPGVTAPDEEGRGLQWGKKYPATDFVGGLSSNNNGIAVMHIDQLGLNAHKSWFMFDEGVLALGAGISFAGDSQVLTTVEQNLRQGDVTINGKPMESSSQQLNGTSWLHHRNTGYIILNNADIKVQAQQKQGNWFDINNNKSRDLISLEVFEVTVNHQQKDNYAYFIYPGKTVNQTQAWFDEKPITILANNTNVQAAWHINKQQLQAVFYQPGQITLSDGTIVSVNKPCVLLLEQALNTFYIATPGTATQVEVTLSQADKQRQFTVETPSGKALLGSTVTQLLN